MRPLNVEGLSKQLLLNEHHTANLLGEYDVMILKQIQVINTCGPSVLWPSGRCWADPFAQMNHVNIRIVSLETDDVFLEINQPPVLQGSARSLDEHRLGRLLADMEAMWWCERRRNMCNYKITYENTIDLYVWIPMDRHSCEFQVFCFLSCRWSDVPLWGVQQICDSFAFWWDLLFRWNNQNSIICCDRHLSSLWTSSFLLNPSYQQKNWFWDPSAQYHEAPRKSATWRSTHTLYGLVGSYKGSG